MNAYELKQAIDKIDIGIRLFAGHLPEMYVRDTINEAIKAKKRMEKELKEIEKK